jgi:hypothetical protein
LKLDYENYGPSGLQYSSPPFLMASIRVVFLFVLPQFTNQLTNDTN